jgi:hypothetical protein
MFGKHNSVQKTLLILLLVYGAASLVHFVHNAEYLADYPNMPESWIREDIYLAWIGLTIVGISGWVLLNYRFIVLGLLLLAVYAVLGLDSLGHYVLASFSEHTSTMNLTILLEVAAAAFVLIEVLRQLVQHIVRKGYIKHDA